MPDIRFYHLESEDIATALPKLMERVVAAGLRAVIKVKDKDQSQQIDELLWSYKPDSFLAHDVEGCNSPADQPIYITTTDMDHPNQADCLVLLDADNWSDFGGFQRILYMFDGRSDQIVEAARGDWKRFRDLGLDMSYWQQNPGGGWAQKN